MALTDVGPPPGASGGPDRGGGIVGPPPIGSVAVEDRVALWSVVAVRIILGTLWLQNANWKRPPDFGQRDRSGLFGFTNGALEHPVFGPFTWLVREVVLPNFSLFGWMVLLTEAALGAFLLLGLLTRLWALVGVSQSLAITFSVLRIPGEWPWAYWLLIAAHLAVFATAAGRVGGIDGLLRTRWRNRDGVLARLAMRLS